MPNAFDMAGTVRVLSGAIDTSIKQDRHAFDETKMRRHQKQLGVDAFRFQYVILMPNSTTRGLVAVVILPKFADVNVVVGLLRFA